MDLDNISKNTRIYEENEDYIILDNEQKMPVIMWKDENVVRDLKISRIMKKAIKSVGEEKYGRGNFFIDRFPKGKEKYLTWYCRPNMNLDLIKEKSNNSY